MAAALAQFVNTAVDKMGATNIAGVQDFSIAQTQDQNANAKAGLHNACMNSSI